MKKFLKKYRHLTALSAVLVMSIAIFMLGVTLHHNLAAPAILLAAGFQLIQFATSKRCGACFNTVLTPEQVKEFGDILKECEGLKALIPGMKDLSSVEGGFAAIKKLPETLKTLTGDLEKSQTEIGRLRKQLIAREQGGNSIRIVNGKAFVTDDCAKALAALFVLGAETQGKMHLLSKDENTQIKFQTTAREIMGMQAKAALTSADIPLPTIYVPQIVELVYMYGQFRANATVFPLGAPTVNLPQLKAGEDKFGLISQSAAINEKKVSAQNVTFTAQKIGGLIRIPTEIEEDTFIPLGQFLARYIARQMALFEDSMGFLGDNSVTYGRYGVGPYVANQAGTPQLQLLAATKTKPTDSTLNDFRAMRTKVNAAVLQRGNAKYYLHPSMEAQLVSFNTLGAPLVYQRQNGSSPATLDGFEIAWVGVMQPYSQAAAPGTFLAFFGELDYWYLGERGYVRVETSRDVFFATDEIAMRAIERIDVQAMAPDAMSALQTAAA